MATGAAFLLRRAFSGNLQRATFNLCTVRSSYFPNEPILRDASPGESLAVKATLEQHVPRVFGFALRLTGDRHQAEDLTQEAFLRAWRAGLGTRSVEQTRVWLFQITANAWRDQLRRRRLAPERAGPIDLHQPGLSFDPTIAAEQRDNLTQALAALDTLPGRQRETLYLSACEGLSNPEIAAILDCTTAAVKTNLSIARRKLREQFQPAAAESHVSN